MAWVPLAAAAVAAVGSIVSGVAQHGQAKSQARFAKAQGELSEDQGAAQAAAIRERAKRQRGTNESLIGASGVGPEGSFADALTDSDINSELDAATAIWNGKLGAVSAEAQARQSNAAGTASLIAGGTNAGSAALQGFGSWKFMQAQHPTGAAPGVVGGQGARAGF